MQSQQQTHSTTKKYIILNRINSPKDLKLLNQEQLRILAKEIRDKILDVVSKNGGHLGGPLGAVELTIAAHYVFDAPDDKIVIDTGHQSYSHKLITGRRDNFHTLRQYRPTSAPSQTYPKFDQSIAGSEFLKTLHGNQEI